MLLTSNTEKLFEFSANIISQILHIKHFLFQTYRALALYGSNVCIEQAQIYHVIQTKLNPLMGHISPQE